MKISLNWLQDFVTLTVTDPQEIARRVTAGVAEVDEVEEQGAFLDGCCVGKVLSLRKHPGADRLNLVDVQTDKGIKHVVCGGTNLREGMRIAFAHVGTRVKHGAEVVTLEKVKIRNVDSEGMICAAVELDLEGRYPPRASEGARPIIDLGDGDEGVGRSLKEYLGIGDVVLHIDNHAITHRADLFSHVGFAQEFVALGLAEWKGVKGGKRGKGVKGEVKFPKDPMPFKVILEDKHSVPHYRAALLKIDGLGETPQWMKSRLEATGWRSISLPIDITNYVMMETGMPHHGFDAGDFRGDLRIRRARKGERITTLDGEDRTLPEGAIIISDDDGVFDLFGIMGGLRTSTKDSTKQIFLQAGIPDPASIRRTVIAMGHRTDAATVYEKGVPRVTAMDGLSRAIELFLELVPGARLVSKLEQWGDEGKAKAVTLPVDQVNLVLGSALSPTIMKKALIDLDFTVTSGKKGALTVTPPLHRLGDIRAPIDLIEEIGRVVGYDRIPTTMPRGDITPPVRDRRMHTMRDSLRESGCTEIVPISLIGDALLKRSGFDPALAVEIKNPLGEELRLMQPSTLPGLLEHAERNLLTAGSELRTFSVATVFSKTAPERTELGVLFADLHGHTDPRSLLHEPFLLLKASIEQALKALGYELDLAVAGVIAPYAHPGRFAELHVRTSLGSAGAASQPYACIGQIFEIHPSVAARFDLKHRAAAALIDITALKTMPHTTTIAQPVPLFPPVAYDVTESVRHTQSVGDILKRLRGSHEHLESVVVKDLYQSPGSPKDTYNLTLTFTYRAKDRTLTDEEAKKVHEKVLAQMGA